MKSSTKFIAFTIVLFAGVGMISTYKKKQNNKIAAKPVDKFFRENAQSSNPVKPKEETKKRIEIENQERLEVRVDRIRRFFSKGMDKLPIVETITYTSRVPWLKGRPAWIADYASHFETSRHFIARSLNGKVDYETQKVSPGDKFNVLRADKDVEFYLLVDLSTCMMDFYYLDKDLDERVFIKSYHIGVGREDAFSPSGSLTPTGKYMLGGKVAIYKPGIENYYQNERTHMIEVFGTRWMPFGQEVENCTDSAKGYGFHGVPCLYDNDADLLIEEKEGVGTKNSDGCIRLRKGDIEELFSIVITKPTTVEISQNKANVTLPMSIENRLD